jgi:Protein of unknown function (DUF664)
MSSFAAELVPSGTSLIGLVRHLVVANRHWVDHYLVGSFDDTVWDFSMTISAGRITRQIMDHYVAAIAERDETIEALGDPRALAVGSFDGGSRTLRWGFLHADIFSEQIDRITGR